MAAIQRFVITHQRTLKKTLSYYLMHITVAMAVAYSITGNLWMALTLSLLEPTVQAFAFFIHENVWNRGTQPKNLPSTHLNNTDHAVTSS